jgi:hypothetical protein
MSPRRIVTLIPIERLYDEAGYIEARRERWLSKALLRDLLRRHPVEFLVANVGFPLQRIKVAKCYEFWKTEVMAHIVDNLDDPTFRLEDFPGEYAYVASEWSGEIQTPIVLLEKYH